MRIDVEFNLNAMQNAMYVFFYIQFSVSVFSSPPVLITNCNLMRTVLRQSPICV